MGLIELLIALSISAGVLVAVGAAVNASFISYSINQEQARLLQTARVAMNRIVSQIRATSEHQPVSSDEIDGFASGLVVTDSGIALFTESGDDLSFQYDAANKQLLAYDTAGVSHVLLRGVEAFAVKFEPMRSQTAVKTGGSYDKLLRATIQLTLKTYDESPDIDETVATQTVTLNASVVPRQNIW